MAQDTNLPIVNPADSFDQKVQDYFNNYFTTPVKMTDMEYEITKSFFIKRTRNEDAASALPAAVIQAANELNVYIVDLISEFEGTSDLKSAVPTFLNLSRRSSSLLGYEQDIIPTTNTARQVVA